MRDFVTSQLGENVDLQVEDVFQLSCVDLTVVVNLLGHFQKPLLIFQPENRLLKCEKLSLFIVLLELTVV